MKTTTSPAKTFLRGTLLTLGIFLRLCLFLPILFFMMWFNYTVDMSGVFQGELAPRQVTALLLDGQAVANYEKMDERQILKLYVQNLPEEQVPDTLALGSSRVMQLNQDMVGGSFFNAGMSGASFMDIANTWYLFERAGKLPKNLILNVDPWLFNGVSAHELNHKADQNLFSEFLEKSLGIASNYQQPDVHALWKALVDPAYFQGNVRYYLKQKKHNANGEGNGTDSVFYPVSGNLSDLGFSVKFSDGSIQYPSGFRSWDIHQVYDEAVVQAATLPAMHGFSEMDPYWTGLFDQFIQHIQAQGVNVVFLLTPYHPFIVLHVANNPQGFDGFFQVEPWLREYADAHQIPVYGSYHAGRVGIPESLFFDGIHCKGEALRLMMPPITQAIQGQLTDYEESYLSNYGSQINTQNALIGIDPHCVKLNPEWFASATQS